MTEPSQVDLNRYSFRLVLGRTDSGAIWPLALHESHGIIASGSDAEALRLSHRLSWRVFSIRSASETPSLSGWSDAARLGRGTEGCDRGFRTG